MASVGKILVVRLSSIGDIILTTPLLRSLRSAFPDAKITFLVKKQYSDLLSRSPYIDNLVTFDQKEGFKGLKKIRDHFREEKFDLFLDIHKSIRSRFLRYTLGIKKTTTYKKYILRRSLLIWFKLNLYGRIRSVYERYFDSVKEYGVFYDGLGTEIHISEEADKKINTLLKHSGYDGSGPLVILCPSATYWNKRWKAQGFIETARYLMHNKSAFVIVHGGPGDEYLCGEIAHEIGHEAINTAGVLTLPESAALLKQAAVVIANDSGLLHLAQSQKTPVVGIYGPTTRELGYFPIDDKSTVIETPLYCRPCTHNGLNYCPKKHFKCMNDIPAGHVIEAALQYIP